MEYGMRRNMFSLPLFLLQGWTHVEKGLFWNSLSVCGKKPNLVKQNYLYQPKHVYNMTEMINNYSWDVCFIVFTPNVMVVMARNKLSV